MAATAKPVEWPDVENHLLKGDRIPGSQVVCRDRWGTPMLPDGKGGYSLIAPINQTWIKESLMIPPDFPRGMVAYRPMPPVVVETVEAPAPAPIAPPASMTPAAPVDAAPVEPSLPAADASAPAADAPAPAQ